MCQIHPKHGRPHQFLYSFRFPGDRYSTNQIDGGFRLAFGEALDLDRQRVRPRAQGSPLLWCRTVDLIGFFEVAHLQGSASPSARFRPRVGQEDVCPRRCRTSVIVCDPSYGYLQKTLSPALHTGHPSLSFAFLMSWYPMFNPISFCVHEVYISIFVPPFQTERQPNPWPYFYETCLACHLEELRNLVRIPLNYSLL